MLQPSSFQWCLEFELSNSFYRLDEDIGTDDTIEIVDGIISNHYGVERKDVIPRGRPEDVIELTRMCCTSRKLLSVL